MEELQSVPKKDFWIGSGDNKIHTSWLSYKADTVTGVVNIITRHNADPTGLNDSTSSMIDAVEDVLSTRKSLFLPPGIFLISQKIVATLTAPLIIVGAGQGLTKIVWDSEDGGFDINLNGKKIIFKDLSIETNVLNGGTALRAYNDSGGFRTSIFGLEFRNVTISGYDNTKQWTKCIDLYDASQIYVNNLFTKGASFVKTSNHITIDGQFDPVEQYISNWHSMWYDTALEIKGNTEGVYVVSPAIINGKVGIKWDNTQEEPLLSVYNGHIAAQKYGIYLHDVADSFISNMLIYEDAGVDPEITDFTGIHLKQCKHIKVKGNTVRTYNTGRVQKGVVSENSRNLIISENSFVGGGGGTFSDFCIDIDSDSSKCRVIDNDFDNVTKEVNLLSTTSIVKSVYKKQVSLYLALGRTVANNTNHDIEWTSQRFDTDNFWNLSNKREIIIPANKGIRKVRLTATVSWDSNNTGIRELAFTKNGNLTTGTGYSQVPANGNTYMTVTSGIIECVDGDIFKVRVKQTSGGDLTLRSGTETAVQLEVVE